MIFVLCMKNKTYFSVTAPTKAAIKMCDFSDERFDGVANFERNERFRLAKIFALSSNLQFAILQCE